MADIMEITELNFDDDNFGGSSSSSNFGGGLELLMNGKMKESKKPTSDIDLNDLNNLENELNDLVDDIIIGEVAPRTPKEAETRLLSFFNALQERTGYTPEMAMKDIKKFLH